MTQYIDKDAVVEEIERKVKAHKKALKNHNSSISGMILKDSISAYQSLLYFLDTLEVKDLDSDISLDRGIEKELDTRWYGEYLNTNKFKESAKYFFELGLKAQKGK